MGFIEDRWVRKDRTRKPEYGTGHRWRAVWSDPDGTRRTKAFPTKEGAKAKLTAVDHAQRSGDYVNPDDALKTLGEYWPRLEKIKAGAAASTRTMYANSWHTHIAPKWQHTPVRKIRTSEVGEWITGLTNTVTGQPLSASARTKVKIVMRVLCEMAVDEKVLNRNPITKVKVQRGRNKERRYLTIAQADALAAAMAPHDLIVWTMLFTAIRRGEAAGLKGRDLDEKRRRLRISRDVDADGNEDDTKSGRHRDVPVTDSLMPRLAEAATAAGPDGWLFPATSGGPWTRDSWRVVWEKRRGASGYADLDTHELRHTAVAWAIQAGANVKTVQRMVGHASAATTLDVYGHLWDDSLDDVAAKVSALVDSERARNT